MQIIPLPSRGRARTALGCALTLASAGSAIGLWACVGDSAGGGTVDGADASGVDSAISDAGTVVTQDGAQGTSDSSSDASTIPTTYLDMTDANNWTAYDLSSAAAFGATAKTFGGGVLAGKYIYLPPAYGGNSVLFRYDITAPFKTKSSWTTYDLGATVDPGGNYGNGLFDGKALYLFPFASTNAVTFDTTHSFVDATSFRTYPINGLLSEAIGGQAFDGQYVYATGYGTTSAIARYDTKAAAFTDGGAWGTYKFPAADGGVNYLTAPAFDKRYLYVGSANDAQVTRFDTQSSFTSSSSYDVFDAKAVSTTLVASIGAIFDGRYVYFPPYSNNVPASVTYRYDTTKPFTQIASWDTFDLTLLDPAAINFHGGTFDGRYVYYPSYNQTGLVVRYDTSLPFAQKGSWQTFRLTGATANIALYGGIAFDGEYVYLIPQGKAATATELTVARFHAKTPASLPAFNASFQ